MQVVMFSGGSGGADIQKALVDTPGVELTIIVNAYDDGLSTGDIRKAYSGMLGPSDIRKIVSRFTWKDEGRLLETRISTTDPLSLVRLPWRLLYYLNNCLEDLKARNIVIQDCAVGNLIFAGCWLTDGEKDFNRTIAYFSHYALSKVLVLNVTDGENTNLSAVLADGNELTSESAISTYNGNEKIIALKLLPNQPKLNEKVKEVITKADVIIYGPGTQHSSLLPTYMTEGLSALIALSKAKKWYIVNLKRDHDIPNESALSLINKLFMFMQPEIDKTWPSWAPEYQVSITDVVVNLDECELELDGLSDHFKIHNVAVVNGKYVGPDVASLILKSGKMGNCVNIR